MQKKSLLKRLLTGVLAAAVTASSVCVFSASAEDTDTFDDLDQTEIVEAMGAGYNLGNQLEATNTTKPSETAWGNPTITAKFIQTVKDAGFDTIRIPVSYFDYIGDADSGYKIDEDWLNRVQEVIDYAIDAGLYVITNVHGDGYYTMVNNGAWLLCAEDDDAQVEIKAKYAAVWKQIATRFKDYDEHLIFESMNEEFDNTYSNQKWWAYKNINAYNQIFVDTVRQTGGNNAKRWLLIPGWNTNITYTAGNYGFELPTDTYRDSSIPADEQRIMISVHYYDPYNFAQNEGSGSVTTWGTEEEMQAVEDAFLQCYKKFVLNGYPVVIGEYGSIDKSDHETVEGENATARALFANTVCKEARSMGMVPVYWDNGWNGDYGFGIFNRSTCTATQQQIIDGIMQAYVGDAEPAPEVIDPITKDEAMAVLYAVSEKTEASVLVSGTADSSVAGATQVRVTFDCASDVSYNQYSSITVMNTIGDGTTKTDAISGYSDVKGATALSITSDLDSEIKSGDFYEVDVFTGSWANASDYAFLVRSLEFLDADGNVLATLTEAPENAVPTIVTGAKNVDIPVTITSKYNTIDTVMVDTESTETLPTEYTITNGKITIQGLADGTHTLTFYAENCVTRTYSLTVKDGKLTDDTTVKLCLYGDVNGDGETDIKDMSLVYKHINETKPLTDEYAIAVADINGNGEVTVADYSKIYKHVNETAPLYSTEAVG